jgi:predicted dehydrogenase
VEIAAVASRDAQRAGRFARDAGIEKAYGSYDELISSPDIDAVHVCAANNHHAALSASALRAGKHVLCEKPLGIDARETAELVETADAADADGVMSGVCFNYRFFPLVREIRERVAAGDAGPVHLVHGAYLQDWLLKAGDWNWRIDPDEGGPVRAVADIGSHWCDLAQYIIGDVIDAVFADVGVLHSSRSLPTDPRPTFSRPLSDAQETVTVTSEDLAGLLLRFSGGARGVVTLSQVSAGRKNGLVIEVNSGDASFFWSQETPERAWIGRRDGPNMEVVGDPATLHPAAARLSHYPPGHVEGWPDAMRNLMDDFHGAIEARRKGDSWVTSVATFSEAHRLVQVAEAVAESTRTGTWTRIEQSAPLPT